MKQAHILILASIVLIVIIGLVTFNKKAEAPEEMPSNPDPTQQVEEGDTSEEDESEVSSEPTQNDTPPYTPPATSNTTPPESTSNTTETSTNDTKTTEELETGDRINEVLIETGSERCEWYIPSGDEEGVALFKGGKVRTDVKYKDETLITIYTTSANYVWTEGESTGKVILNYEEDGLFEDGYVSPTQITAYIKGQDRLACEDKVINDEHFSPPKKIEFNQ